MTPLILEVARMKSGLYDAEAAFSKAFKRWIGGAPGAYRRTAESRSQRKLRSSSDGP